MAGGLRIGSLYVSLSASSSGLVKGLDAGLKAVDRFAKEVKKTSEDAAKVAASFTVLSGAALKLASGVDGPTKKAMDGMTASTQLLAVQVADMLLPAVREVTAMFKGAAQAVASLSPETKAAVSQFALVAVQVMAAAKAISVLAQAVGPAISMLRGVMGVISALGSGPLLGIIAAIGLVVGVVTLLHRAWRKNWGGIQDSTGEVLEWLRSGFTQLVEFFRKAWDSILSGGERFVMGLLDIVDTVQKVTGVSLVDTAGAREGFKGLFADLRSGAFFSEAFKFGKSVGASVVDGLKEEWALIGKELGLDGLVSKVKGMFAGGSGKVIGLGRGMAPSGPIVSGAVSNTSTAVTAAAEAMKALRAAVAADELAFRRHLESLADAEVGVRQWLRSLGEAPTGGVSKAGTATVSLSSQAGRAGRFGAGMTVASSATKKSPVVAQAEADMARTMKTIGGIMLNSLGSLGRTISNIAQAAAQGGPWAAIIAAIMEVLQHTKAFQSFMEILDYGLERLGQMVEPLVESIFPIIEQLTVIGTEILAPVFKALKPLFDGIAAFAEELIPVLSSVGYLFEAIAPILEVIGTVVGAVLKALGPVLELVGGVVKLIATVLLGIIIALNEIAAAFGDTAARAEADRLKALIDKMWAPNANEKAKADAAGATAAWHKAAADEAGAKAAQDIAESLTNVPSGFKLNALRFAADTGLGGLAAGGPAGSSGGVYVENMYVEASDPEELADKVQEAKARKIAAKTGNRHGKDDEGV